MSVESIDATADFLIALDRLGEPFQAIGKMVMAAVEFRRWGVSMQLDVQTLTREEFDSYEGEEKFFPTTATRARFWSKRVTLWRGEGYDPERGLEGGVALVLYTDAEPVEDDLNEGLAEEFENGILAEIESRQRV